MIEKYPGKKEVSLDLKLALAGLNVVLGLFLQLNLMENEILYLSGFLIFFFELKHARREKSGKANLSPSFLLPANILQRINKTLD